MSLINKMLKDLDARGGQGHTPLTAEMHAVEETPEGRSRLFIGVLGVVVVSLAVGGVVGWRYYQKAASGTAPEARLVQGTVKPAAVPAQAGTKSDATGPVGATTVSTSAPGGTSTEKAAGPSGKVPAAPDAVAVQLDDPATKSSAAKPINLSEAESAEARSVAAKAKEMRAAQLAAAQAAARGEGQSLNQQRPERAAPAASESARNASSGMPSGADSGVKKEPSRKLREQELARIKARAKAAAASRSAAPVSATPADAAGDRLRASETAYRRALAQLSEGRVNDALEVLEQALRLNPRHEAARQTVIGLYIEGKHGEDAMRHLQAALSLDPRQLDLAMLLARMQIERGGNGIETLQRSLPAAAGQADYLAFLAGALERAGRHREAAEQYQAALRLKPQNGVWWMGLGVALQGDQRNADAAEAYRRAQSTGTLTPELQTFVERRLQQLPR